MTSEGAKSLITAMFGSARQEIEWTREWAAKAIERRDAKLAQKVCRQVNNYQVFRKSAGAAKLVEYLGLAPETIWGRFDAMMAPVFASLDQVKEVAQS
jgi:hypothetical protein